MSYTGDDYGARVYVRAQLIVLSAERSIIHVAGQTIYEAAFEVFYATLLEHTRYHVVRICFIMFVSCIACTHIMSLYCHTPITSRRTTFVKNCPRIVYCLIKSLDV